MFCKVCLILMLAAGVFSLECVFEVLAGDTNLDIEGGVDYCESSDNYCAKVDVNGIKAKGCSKTSTKITGFGFPIINCAQVGCNAQNTLCCCEGNKCNGATSTYAIMPILVLPAARLFLMN